MPISFAGVDLLLEDPDGDVQAWFDHWLDLDDNRMVAAWPSGVWNKSGNIPLPNYSRPLRPKLNTWYRPVGASRWSFGLFLADTKTKNRITSAIGTGNSGKSLRIEVPQGFWRSWLAYLLPCHPVSDDASAEDGLWILPIVDERWWWQFIGANLVTISDSSTWAVLLTNLAETLGISLTYSTIYPTYGSPNATRFNAASNANAAILLDAAAHSVGRRILLDYLRIDENNYAEKFYIAAKPSESVSKREINFANPLLGAGSLQAGNVSAEDLNSRGLFPSVIQVVFRKWANGIVWDGEYYVKEISPSSIGYSNTTADYVKTITTSALADFTSGSGTPDNNTAVSDLATQIAVDFLDGVSWIQDSNYIGTSRWIETGFDDYIEFSLGRRRRDGSYECKTRVHSLPYNFCIPEMLHQLPSTHEYPDVIEGKLDGSLSSQGTATLNVYESSDATTLPSDTGRDLTVTDWYGFSGSAGQRIFAHKAGKQWRPITEACSVF